MNSFRQLAAGVILMLITGFLHAQAPLPTSWDCTTGTTPAFWTTNSASYYTASGYYHSPPNALKFEFTGAYLTIFMADAPDTVEYYLRGAGFSGGTFLIQQSPDGSSWTTMRTFNNTNIPNTSLTGASPFIDIADASTRYVRFYYSYKNSGNVGIDDVRITLKPAGPEAEISVKVNHELIQTGQTAVTGNLVTIPCMILNNGGDSVLRITGHSISGTNASMFAVSGLPSTVPAGDSASFDLIYTASGADGTKTASLTIDNSDADEDPYIIHLWATKGCCATEPVGQPANFNISLTTSYQFRVGFIDGATPPERYIVLKKSSPITETPADGQSYLKGSYIGNAQVCYTGPAAYFYPSNVVAGTTYFIKVFPVNGYPGYENYLTTNPANAQVTTLANMIGTYYDNMFLTSTDLRTALHDLVSPHTRLEYDDYDNYLINNVIYRDTVENGQWRKMVKCAYSNDVYIYADPFSWSYLSREHNFCQSWMPTSNEPDFTSLPEYSDYHNLIPVNQNAVNSYRNYYPLGEVADVTYTFKECKMGDDSLGNRVFEPRDEVKGDAARAMFYMVTSYNGVSGNQWALPEIISGLAFGQDQAVLKKWHFQDPPDAYEMAKNDFIYSLQGNRNPFIDSAQWVALLDFTIYAGVDQPTGNGAPMVYPNPVSEALNIQFPAIDNGTVNIELFNYSGCRVLTKSAIITGDCATIPLDGLSKGLYLYQISLSDGAIFHGKVIVM